MKYDNLPDPTATSIKRYKTLQSKLNRHFKECCGKMGWWDDYNELTGLDQVTDAEIERVLGEGRPAITTMGHASHLPALMGLTAATSVVIRKAAAEMGPLRTISTLDGASRTDFLSPLVDHSRARQTIANMLADINFDGVAFYEPEKIRGGVLAQGARAFESTFHGVGLIPAASLEAALKKAANTRRLVSLEGYPPVDLRPLELGNVHAQRWGEYMAKPPSAEKHLTISKKGRRAFKVRSNQLGLASTVRMIELLSNLTIPQLIVARGPNGLRWKRQIFEYLGPLGTKHAVPVRNREQLRSFWRQYWVACDHAMFAANPVMVR